MCSSQSQSFRERQLRVHRSPAIRAPDENAGVRSTAPLPPLDRHAPILGGERPVLCCQSGHEKPAVAAGGQWMASEGDVSPHLSVELAALDSAPVPHVRRLAPEASQVPKYALRPLPCHKQSYPLATSTVQRDNAGSLSLLWGNPIPDNGKCRGSDCPAKYKQAGHQPNYVSPRCSHPR